MVINCRFDILGNSTPTRYNEILDLIDEIFTGINNINICNIVRNNNPIRHNQIVDLIKNDKIEISDKIISIMDGIFIGCDNC
jgi:hypothetical protein